MRVYIPSYSRAAKVHSTVQLCQDLEFDVTLCILKSEHEAYHAANKYLEPQYMLMPDKTRGIGPMKQWVLDNVKDDLFVLSDDDIRGFSWKEHIAKFGELVPASKDNILAAFNELYSVYSVNRPGPFAAAIIDRWVIAKPNKVFMKRYGFMRQVLILNKEVKRYARFDRLPLMVDVDFSLQCLKAGVKMWIPTFICHESPAMTTRKEQGGCGEAREKLARGRDVIEVNRAMSKRLYRLHKDVMELNPDPFATSKLHRISWRKAYQIGLKHESRIHRN